MIKLGFLNSRMKDFLTSGYCPVGSISPALIWLKRSISLFKQRKTSIPLTIDPFTESFINEKQIQWTAFRRKLNQYHVPSEFQELVEHLDEFLTPVVSMLTTGSTFHQSWLAPGPWR